MTYYRWRYYSNITQKEYSDDAFFSFIGKIFWGTWNRKEYMTFQQIDEAVCEHLTRLQFMDGDEHLDKLSKQVLGKILNSSFGEDPYPRTDGYIPKKSYMYQPKQKKDGTWPPKLYRLKVRTEHLCYPWNLVAPNQPQQGTPEALQSTQIISLTKEIQMSIEPANIPSGENKQCG